MLQHVQDKRYPAPCHVARSCVGRRISSALSLDRLAMNRTLNIMPKCRRHYNRCRTGALRPVAWRFEIRQHGACRALLHFGAYPFVQGVDVRKREAVPHGAADDWIRVVFRQDGAKHVERADVGRGLAATIRVRREDEFAERLFETRHCLNPL